MGKDSLRIFVFIILTMILGCTIVPAQSEWAVLDASPTGKVPAGDVLRPGHLGREVGNVELIIHFYHE